VPAEGIPGPVGQYGIHPLCMLIAHLIAKCGIQFPDGADRIGDQGVVVHMPAPASRLPSRMDQLGDTGSECAC